MMNNQELEDRLDRTRKVYNALRDWLVDPPLRSQAQFFSHIDLPASHIGSDGEFPTSWVEVDGKFDLWALAEFIENNA